MTARGTFGVFSLTSPETPSSKSPGVDDTGRIVRRRQYHKKSRHGCMKCKSRKVKCDENRPTCRKCSMRGEECTFDSFDEGERRLPPTPHDNQDLSIKPAFGFSETANICQVGASTGELLSLRLMHHFEHFTSDTLLFGKPFWRDQILPLALHHDYLMHAVLTISASHLNCLLPQLAEYKRAMNTYLSYTLPGFRQGIGTVTSSRDSDAVIACGFLLLYYAWSVPFFNETDESSLNIGSDGLLWFATGLQEVITTAYEAQSRGSKNGGIFANFAIPQYVQMLSDIRTRTESAGHSYNFAENFLGQHQLLSEVAQQGCRETKIESRLDPIFYTVDSLTLGLDLADIMPSFVVYSLTWPTKAPKEFISQIKRGESHALLVMLSFYASVWLTLSPEVWWAHRRCRMMCEIILAKLTGSQKTSSWNENITHIVRYFKFNRNGNGTWEVGSP